MDFSEQLGLDDSFESRRAELHQYIVNARISKEGLASFLYENKANNAGAYNSFVRTIEKYQSKGAKMLDQSMLLTLQSFLVNFGYKMLCHVLSFMNETTKKFLTPFDVSQHLFEHYGVQCIRVKGESRILYRKGNLSFEVPIVDDLPDFPHKMEGDMLTIFREMTNAADISVLPHWKPAFRYATFFATVCRYSPEPTIDVSTKTSFYLKFKDPSTFVKTLPQDSKLFVAGQWNPRFKSMVISMASTPEVATELATANKKEIVPKLYIGFFRHFVSKRAEYVQQMKMHYIPACMNVLDLYSLKDTLILDNKAPKDPVSQTFVGRVLKSFDVNSYAAFQAYLNISRGARGTDNKDYSVSTRNIHFGMFYPLSVSTAVKFIGILEFLKTQIEKINKVYFAGCHPGNALPMFCNAFPDLVKGRDINRRLAAHVEGRTTGFNLGFEQDEVRGYLNQDGTPKWMKELYFFDIQYCNRSDYKWDCDDFFKVDFINGSFIISDIWTSATGEALSAFRMRLLRTICLLSKGNHPLRPSETIDCQYAIKMNIVVDMTRKDSASATMLPTGFDRFFRAQPGLFYLTKFGRPHNQEFLFSSFPLETSHRIGNVDEFMKALSIMTPSLFYYNHYRNIAFLTENVPIKRPRGVGTMKLEYYPVHVSKNVLEDTANYETYYKNYFIDETEQAVADKNVDDLLSANYFPVVRQTVQFPIQNINGQIPNQGLIPPLTAQQPVQPRINIPADQGAPYVPQLVVRRNSPVVAPPVQQPMAPPPPATDEGSMAASMFDDIFDT